MAWAFDETNDYVTLGDDAALTLPDADWSIGGWVKLTDNTGTAFQYFASWNSFNVNNSFNWYFAEASEASNPNKLQAVVKDGGGDVFELTSSGTPGTSTVWQHLVIERSGSTCTQYVNGSADGSETDSLVDAVNHTGTFEFGRRSDNDPDRYFGGSMAEWFKMDRALSASEITALANGMSPSRLPDLSWYCPMMTGQYAEYRAGLTTTNNGSTPADHAPVQPPFAFDMEWQGAFTAAIPAAGIEILRRRIEGHA